MAIYHMSVKTVQRSKGRSAVEAAAYRAADKLVDERTGVEHDYTRKKGLIHAEIVTPDGTKIDRAKLWNMAEKVEKRKDATTAREYEIAIPAELPSEARLSVVREYCEYLATRHGCAVDMAIHGPSGGNQNYHAHIMCTTRKFEQSTLGAKCDVELSDTDRRKKNLPKRKDELVTMREAWANIANRALERHGIEARIDHRTLEAQGIDRLPTKHLGPTAKAIEKKGRHADRADRQREAEALQAELNARLAEIDALKQDLAAEYEYAAALDEREQTEIRYADFLGALREHSKNISPIAKRQEAWRQPYIDYINQHGATEQNCEYVLGRAEFDASDKGVKEIRDLDRMLDRELRKYNLIMSTKAKVIDTAVNAYRLHEDRFTDKEALQKSLLQGIEIGLARQRGLTR